MKAPPPALIVRDLALIALALFAWRLGRALQDAASAWTWPAAIATGLLIPLAGFLVHEWGHLLGALAARARVEYPPTPLAVFLFKFDVGRNDRRQFLAMANGGFAASLLFVALALALLRVRYHGDAIALALTALGVVATFVLEVPESLRVRRGGPLPTGAAFVGAPPPRY
ncbi:hypothetical protein [Solimonas soli]|uniref:hypothetical protein n=1 Tax=Solimonas soli TaxID=413479 RepID=UPI0004847660|nr:hypothetical protein [Solimonas soli]